MAQNIKIRTQRVQEKRKEQEEPETDGVALKPSTIDLTGATVIHAVPIDPKSIRREPEP